LSFPCVWVSVSIPIMKKEICLIFLPWNVHSSLLRASKITKTPKLNAWGLGRVHSSLEQGHFRTHSRLCLFARDAWSRGSLAKRDRQLRETSKSGLGYKVLPRPREPLKTTSVRERDVIYSLLDKFTDLICANLLLEFLVMSKVSASSFCKTIEWGIYCSTSFSCDLASTQLYTSHIATLQCNTGYFLTNKEGISIYYTVL